MKHGTIRNAVRFNRLIRLQTKKKKNGFNKRPAKFQFPYQQNSTSKNESLTWHRHIGNVDQARLHRCDQRVARHTQRMRGAAQHFDLN